MIEEKTYNHDYQKLTLWLNFWKVIIIILLVMLLVVFLTLYIGGKNFKLLELEYQLEFRKQENLTQYLIYANKYPQIISPHSVEKLFINELGKLQPEKELSKQDSAIKDKVITESNQKQTIKKDQKSMPEETDVTSSGNSIKGIASYYADKFQGRPTASGETFDNHALTAAHRTFPFGTLLKVTNTNNNTSVIVKVNDRGPFHKDRIIDLSKAAASKIGITQSGTGEVSIEKVIPEKSLTNMDNMINIYKH